jgi:succinoglycan biosynthesis transport protein ExoP
MTTRHEHASIASDVDESGIGPLDVNTVLCAVRYWWRIAAPLAVVLAIVAAGLVAYLSKPKFTAAAWLIIREKPEYLLNPQVMEDPRKFVQNQMELLRSPPVIDPVANKPEVYAAPELASGMGDPAERLRRLLQVRAQGQSDFFVIEFTSESPHKAALIVNEVAKAYLMLQDRDLSQRMEATITRLEKQRADQQQLIERLREQVQEKTKTLTGVDPYATKASMHIGIQDSLSPLQSQIVENEIAHAMSAAHVGAEEEMLKNEKFEVSATEIEERLQSLPEIIVLRRRISDATLRMQEHERTSANLTKNSIYQQLQRQKTADEEQLAKRSGELRTQAKTELEKAARMKRTDEVAKLRKELDAKRMAVDILRQRMQEERAKQQDYKGETVELEFLRTDYESAAKVFEAINDRIVTMRLEQHAPDRVMLFREAAAPSFPDRTLPYNYMGLAAMLALVGPFGLAIGYEMLHRRVSGRRELEKNCQLSVVAEVTEMPRVTSRQLSQRNLSSRELQLFEESIYGLRTQLLLAQPAGKMRTLAVTSAISREGKTSVAVQLALSIARSTGELTLLIDCDLRCPDVHRIFEIERAPGLVELMRGSATCEEAIDETFSPALHVLPAGRLDAVPHRLLSGSTFPRLLERLQQKYHFIVIDTPPILPASEALMVARAADATVVCARRDFSRIDQVTEAYARLKSAGVPVAGAVLNGISPKTYVHRYGSYYYDRSDEPGLVASEAEAGTPDL